MLKNDFIFIQDEKDGDCHFLNDEPLNFVQAYFLIVSMNSDVKSKSERNQNMQIINFCLSRFFIYSIFEYYGYKLEYFQIRISNQITQPFYNRFQVHIYTNSKFRHFENR
ncbi:hypothetical protein EDEG_04045 [Edhazardia aedis USNM 41457]|uniref:Uncharacterized protein n=1 Tax=Edhazardia aedis (strain USNM 41457) TaxID=1003232 RepID=J9D0Y2_EDHAE|nr:hypothetical protein EDEG_04045 [Edhazardia aedis USNM 41457]|eukprot:EJW01234.1 hypothetical protein EDEG_04045 [Edhazardia aedis USNM 41457]